jgi:hypothetical protein
MVTYRYDIDDPVIIAGHRGVVLERAEENDVISYLVEYEVGDGDRQAIWVREEMLVAEGG